MSINNLDLSKYKVVPNVPVLDEGTIHYDGPDGKSEPFKVTPEFLARCAKNMNRREERTGDLCPLVLGKHTSMDANPQDQPPVVGLARHWRVGDWVDGLKALYCDYLINKEDVDAVKRYPRRSAEVWLSRAEIDPISLLGSVPPERDLGLVLLNRKDDIRVAILSRDSEKNMPAETDRSMESAEAKETGGVKGLEALNAKVDQLAAKVDQLLSGMGTMGPAAGATGPAPAEGEGEISDEEINNILAELEKQHGTSGDESAESAESGPKKDEPVSQNSCAAPGGSNTYMPSGDEVKKLQRQVAELQDAAERNKFEKRLSGLNVEVPADELDTIMTLPPSLRDGHIERISKNYRTKAPINSGLDAVQNSVLPQNTNTKGLTPKECDEVVKLARSKKITFEAAAREFGKPVTK